MIYSQSSETAEWLYLDLESCDDTLHMFQPRQYGLRYYPHHHGDNFLIVTNKDGATEMCLMTAPVTAPGVENWKMVRHYSHCYSHCYSPSLGLPDPTSHNPPPPPAAISPSPVHTAPFPRVCGHRAQYCVVPSYPAYCPIPWSLFRQVLPHTEARLIEDIELFKDFLVIEGREAGLTQVLWAWALIPTISHVLPAACRPAHALS